MRKIRESFGGEHAKILRKKVRKRNYQLRYSVGDYINTKKTTFDFNFDLN